MTTEPIFVSNMTPAPVRWGLSVFGLVIAVLAGKDLLRALWPLNIFTPFFALLMGAGVIMGGALIYACLFGPDERWQIDRGRLIIVRTLRSTKTSQTYAPAQIDKIDIQRVEHDGSPDTWRLTILLTTGQTLTSPSFSLIETAEAARDRLLTRW